MGGRLQRWRDKPPPTEAQERAQYRRIVKYLVVPALFVILVLLIGVEIQVQQAQGSQDKLRGTVRDTQAVVHETQVLLDGAINNPNNAAQAEATARAIAEIDAIARSVCGGPCPEGG